MTLLVGFDQYTGLFFPGSRSLYVSSHLYLRRLGVVSGQKYKDSDQTTEETKIYIYECKIGQV